MSKEFDSITFTNGPFSSLCNITLAFLDVLPSSGDAHLPRATNRVIFVFILEHRLLTGVGTLDDSPC